MSAWPLTYRWRAPKTWGGPGPNPLHGRRCRAVPGIYGRSGGPHNVLVEFAEPLPSEYGGGRLSVVCQFAAVAVRANGQMDLL